MTWKFAMVWRPKSFSYYCACAVKRFASLKRFVVSKMAKFTEHEVVPDVLSAAPASVAEVVWPSGAKAEQGNVLTPTQVRLYKLAK